MRVALDAGPALGAATGVGRYARELGVALEGQGVEVVRYAVSWKARPDESVARWRVPAKFAQRAWQRFDRPKIERLVGRVDVVHATNFVLPPLRVARGVVTVHDLSFMREDTFPGGERLRTLVPWSIERASAIVVPSSPIKDEVTDRFSIPGDRIHVTPEGVSPVFFGATPLGDMALGGLGIRKPFAVAVGTIEPRKNLPHLLQAWRAAADALGEWTLVIAGPRGWGPEMPETPGVTLLGWVGDETLPGLVAAAGFFCYPSLYEGFGLPPLEAMAAGTPALVGRYAAAEGVVGDAALMVDPHDVDELATGLRRLAGDEKLRRSLSLAGRSRATAFTWERTARTTLGAYEAALE